MLKLSVAFLRHLRAYLFGYSVFVWFDGRQVHHLATSWNDALEWLACYPSADSAVVYERFFGQLALVPIAARRASR